MNGWASPFSREVQAIASLYDLTLAANADPKKRNQLQPYPRPWKTEEERRSQAPTVDQKTILDALQNTREHTQHGD